MATVSRNVKNRTERLFKSLAYLASHTGQVFGMKFTHPPSALTLSSRVAAKHGNWNPTVFDYPFLDWFPESDDAELDFHFEFSGARLQDWHLWYFWVSSGGDFKALTKVFRDGFSEYRTRNNRFPIGRAAKVWAKDRQVWMYVAIGEMLLCGDEGGRHNLPYKLPIDKQGGITLHDGALERIGNAIPTPAILLGTANEFWSDKPTPMTIDGPTKHGMRWSDPRKRSTPIKSELEAAGNLTQNRRKTRIAGKNVPATSLKQVNKDIPSLDDAPELGSGANVESTRTDRSPNSLKKALEQLTGVERPTGSSSGTPVPQVARTTWPTTAAAWETMQCLRSLFTVLQRNSCLVDMERAPAPFVQYDESWGILQHTASSGTTFTAASTPKKHTDAIIATKRCMAA